MKTVEVTGFAKHGSRRDEFDGAACVLMERLAAVGGTLSGFHDTIGLSLCLTAEGIPDCVNMGAVENAVRAIPHLRDLTFTVR
jgi:hypothetical protein